MSSSSFYCIVELPGDFVEPGDESHQVFAQVGPSQLKFVMDYGELARACRDANAACPDRFDARPFRWPLHQ